MKQLPFNSIFTAVVMLTVLPSCQKEKITSKTDIPTANPGNGIYILNAGDANLGSAGGTLTYYNFASKVIVADQYNVANGTQLGCSGNDIEIYGSKMYIAITPLSDF